MLQYQESDSILASQASDAAAPAAELREKVIRMEADLAAGMVDARCSRFPCQRATSITLHRNSRDTDLAAGMWIDRSE